MALVRDLFGLDVEEGTPGAGEAREPLVDEELAEVRELRRR
jgi:hypothetical protein